MNSLDISTDQLRRALQIKQQIESLEQQLNSVLSDTIQKRQFKIQNGAGRRRTMSTAARARIAAAQRARWAKVRGTSSTIQNSKSNIQNSRRPRRKMSAAGRAAIAAAARARWARYNASNR